MNTTTYDLTSLDFLQNPYPTLAKMRQHDPIYWCEAHEAWILTRYEDVVGAFKNKDLSSDRRGMVFKRMLKNPVDLLILPLEIRNFLRLIPKMLFGKHGEKHKYLRGPLARVFNDFNSFERIVDSTAEELANSVRTQTSFDALSDFATPLVLNLLCQAMGIPHQDRDRIRQWTQEINFMGGIGDIEKARKDGKVANRALGKLEFYFRRLIGQPELNEGIVKDLLKWGRLAKLSDTDIVSQYIMLTSAGNVPTIDQLGNAAHLVLSRPTLYQQIRADSSLIDAVITESLRYDVTTFIAHRVALKNMVLGGKQIKKGDVIYLCIGAANRDPEVFKDPEEFDIYRENNDRHIGFGAGPHVCIGARLALQELRAGLKTLLHDLPELKLAENSSQVYDTLEFRKFKSLQVNYI